MECNKALELLSEYIDGMLDDSNELQEHLKICENCRIEYELLKSIIEGCHQFEEVDLPDDFHQKLHDRLIKDNNVYENKNKLTKKHYSIAAAFLILALSIGIVVKSGVIGLGSQKRTEASKEEQNMAYTQIAKAPEADTQVAQDSKAEKSGPAPEILSQQKIAAVAEARMTYSVISVNLDKDEYDEYYKKIISDIEALGGLTTSQDGDNYSISQDNMDSLAIKLIEEYKIDDVVISSTDITEQYSALNREVAEKENNRTNQTSDNGTKTADSSTGNEIESKKVELEEMQNKAGRAFIELHRK